MLKMEIQKKYIRKHKNVIRNPPIESLCLSESLSHIQLKHSRFFTHNFFALLEERNMKNFDIKVVFQTEILLLAKPVFN
jgi:hypothetical protein